MTLFLRSHSQALEVRTWTYPPLEEDRMEPIPFMGSEVWYIGNKSGKEARGLEPDFEEYRLPYGGTLRHVSARR